jgi:tRNA1Val (adenine37-N6)-methyltransferase
MPNAYFDFKQFRIAQDRCAMKVSTDACIQGAWLATVFRQNNPATILDIGAGTGLLSLMLAQEVPHALITAVEINEDACVQAAENVRNSPWAERVQVCGKALQDMDDTSLYDAIICNPPFFHNHLESQDSHRSMARHSHTLSKEVLAEKVAQLLSADGKAGILYPASEWDAWIRIARKAGLHIHSQLLIRPHLHKAPNRVVGLMSRQAHPQTETTELCIYESGSRTYTPEFIDLLNPYYLHL